MKSTRSRLAVAAALALALLPSRARAEEPARSHIMLRPEEITWGDCSSALPPGARCAAIEGDRRVPNVLFTYRIKMPDDYKVAPHFHPADEHVTVIAGTFNMGLGDTFDAKATRPMGAGSFMVMPKGAHHFAWSRGETIVQVHALGPWEVTYVHPEDDPRKR